MTRDPVAAFAVDTLGGVSMGTTWSVRLLAPGRDLRRLHTAIETALARIVAQMSNWEPDSDISRYNRAPAGSWHRLSEEFRDVLTCALHVAKASNGAFDPSVGPLVDAWGFGPPGDRSEPQAIERHELSRRVDWRRIEVRADGNELLQPGGLQLDLCAIAKGYAVDRVADCLREEGVDNALVEVGGELYGMGRRADGRRWRVMVDDEDDDASERRIVELDRAAIASSGDRWHRRDDGHGRMLSHSIDPRGGVPVEDAPRLVSVLADNAMEADAWATALTVMGAREGFDVACDKAMAVRFVDCDGRERMTPAFHAALST